jgi:hypothetical protein
MGDKKCVIFSGKCESGNFARNGDGRVSIGDRRLMGMDLFEDFDIGDVETSECNIT